MTMYIDYNKDEGFLPKCPAKDCQQVLLLCDLPVACHKTYQHICLDVFLKEHGDTVKNTLQQKAILKKLTQERRQFINDTYPAAIALIATVAFKKKAKTMALKKQKLIKNEQQHFHRRCMNNTCKGILNDQLQCLTCQTEFCQKCEARLSPDHICKQEDLEAINLIHNMIKCPGCKLPVFKNMGCNSITCSYCQTNFEYDTGEAGGHGSHNTKLMINLDQKQRLSVSYKHKLSKYTLDMLLNIEAQEPKEISKDTLLLPIKKYYETNNKEQAAEMLAKRLEQYYLNKLQLYTYATFMVQLEKTLTGIPVNYENLISQLKSF